MPAASWAGGVRPEFVLHAADRSRGETAEDAADHVPDRGSHEDVEREARGGLRDPGAFDPDRVPGRPEQRDEDQPDTLDEAASGLGRLAVGCPRVGRRFAFLCGRSLLG